MRKNFNYDFVNKTIVGFEAAINRANKGINPEYAELSSMLAAHPDFTVVIKKPEKKRDSRSYKHLTLARMEEYINTQFSGEELSVKLIEFRSIMRIAEVKGAKYPLTKKWFLATYAEYKELWVSESETAALKEAAAADDNDTTEARELKAVA